MKTHRSTCIPVRTAARIPAPTAVRTALLLGTHLCAALSLAAQDRSRHPYAMDYGPFVTASWHAPWPAGNDALKGLSIQVGKDPAAHVIFDTELLRVSAVSLEFFRDLRGTPYDGAHGPTPELAGRQCLGTPVAPGWARDGKFGDPRPIPHGPLPSDWARYRGLYLHGDRVVLSYTVGDCPVLEGYQAAGKGVGRILERTLDLGPSAVPMTLAVGGRPGSKARALAGGGIVVLPYEIAGVTDAVRTARARVAWAELDMQGPSAADYADAAAGNGVVTEVVAGFAPPPGDAGVDGMVASRLHDGDFARGDDDPRRNTWFDGRARLRTDLQKAIEVGQISTFSIHKGARAPQRFKLYGAVDNAAADAVDPVAAGWQLIAAVDSSALGGGGRHGAVIAKEDSSLGTFRYLLWELEPAAGRGKSGPQGTFFTEIDIYDAATRPASRAPGGPRVTAIAVVGAPSGAAFDLTRPEQVCLRLPARAAREQLKLVVWDGPASGLAAFQLQAAALLPATSLLPLTAAGPGRWGPPLLTKGVRSAGAGPYVVDRLTTPSNEAAGSYLRFAAFDFFADGRAALSTWNGDVWILSGIDDELQRLSWKRFATGLFDPLGLRIVDDVIYTLGRDQITRLHDTNADGEADFYECFNNDVLMTKAFHEFAFDLQTDADGNFYFAKGGPVRPGGRGFDKIVPHHGCVLKVAKDGARLEVFATGLRAPNGLGVGPHGEVTSGDNEGTWMPVCRLNWIRPGSFLGCVDTAHRTPAPRSYDPPLCFLPMGVDNSGGGQTWVTSAKWGPFQGELLHLSYGQSALYKVLREEVDGVVQGGVTRFPLKFTSSCMRGRFHPQSGQLFVVGLKGWQTNAARLTGFDRVRYTGAPVRMATGIQTRRDGIALTFTCGLDRTTAEQVDSYEVEVWDYVWAQTYGSPEISTVDPDRAARPYTKVHDPVKVRSATLSADGKTVVLELEKMKPVMQMHVKFDLDAADGAGIKGEVFSSIHKVPGPGK